MREVVVAVDADSQSIRSAVELACEVLVRRVERGEIGRIVTRDRPEQERRVLDGACERPDVVERGAHATTPCRLTRPNVGFTPTTPLTDPGIRIDAPVSLPRAPKAERTATATPEPALEPPG